jgi:tRNA-specific adenosine deaminase 1
VLHDWHAEILALRAFNYWLLTEVQSLLTQERSYRALSEDNKPEERREPFSPYIRRRRHEGSSSPPTPPFELNPDLKIYMYCTCAPCGDASMELCMAAQEDATPWELPADGESKELLDGRGHFSRLGIVRRKPSRADAEATRSKSCSDKLALRQVSSLLSFESGLFVATTENAYLEGVILPEGELSRTGCERCFGEDGRMGKLKGRFWHVHETEEDERRYGYRFRPFKVLSIPTQQFESIWHFGKTDPAAGASSETQEVFIPRKAKPAVVSAAWTTTPFLPLPHSIVDNGSKSLPKLRGSGTGLYETIINGVKQGNRASEPIARGASALSRAKLWGLSKEIAKLLPSDMDRGSGNEALVEERQSTMALHILKQAVEAQTYHEFKNEQKQLPASLKARKDAIQDTKKVLNGWKPNIGDENWGLEVLIDPRKRKR